jgi:amidohydrolase
MLPDSRLGLGNRALVALVLAAAAGLAPLAAQQAAATPQPPVSPLADRLPALAAAKAPAAVQVRHWLHQHPELSNREVETGKRVAEELRKLGLDVRTGIAHNGVVAVLEGGRPGPVVAVRADIDALPVTEQTDFPFKSIVRTTYQGKEVGVAHACGHDIHTSVQLGVAAMLTDLRAELAGTVVFVFQPAEEGVPPGEKGGAPLMLEEGLFGELQPAAIFALHTEPALDVGQAELAPGPVMAAADRFHATIRGKQSHGAYPHIGVDPVVTAAQAILALQTIRSRNVDPLAPSVVTVGIVRGGERFNIIPDEVYLEGTVRTYGGDVQDLIEQRIREVLDGVTKAAGATYTLDYVRVTPATVNHGALTALVARSLVGALGADNVRNATPTMGAEDFAFFAERLPAVYFDLGIREPGGQSGGLHTPDFRAMDASVEAGMRAMSRVVLDFLAAAAAGPAG